jgi:hypothetical protein
MATNWKMNEIIDVLNSGKTEDIQDLGRRFPLTAVAVASGDFAKVLGALPDRVTVRNIEAVLKGEVQEADNDSDDSDDSDDVEEKPVKAKKAKAAAKEIDEDDENNYQSMSSNELYKLLSKRGLTKGRKFSKKADMIAALEANDAGTDEEADEVEADDPIALYKECKSKGLKVKARQSAEYYKKELAKFDDSDDDWDDDEEEEKPAKKAPKKATKAKAKEEHEPVEDDEDEDDWDI